MKSNISHKLSVAAMMLVAATGLASCKRPSSEAVKSDRPVSEMSEEAKRLYVEKQVDRWPVVGSNSGAFAVELSAHECKILWGEVKADTSCRFNGKACHATKGGTTVIVCITEAD